MKDFNNSLIISFKDYLLIDGKYHEVQITNNCLIYTCILNNRFRIFTLYKKENKYHVIKFIDNEVVFYKIITCKDKIVVCLSKIEHNSIIILDEDLNQLCQRFIPVEYFLCYVNNDYIYGNIKFWINFFKSI